MSDPTASTAQTEPAKPTWGETLRVYREPPTLRMLFLGFAAGLPLLLVLGTLGFRLREAGIDRTTIGFLSWVGLAYGVKWMWAPLVDRLPLPLLTRWLGRRRSWLLLAQLAVAAGLVGMALFDPKVALNAVVWCAVLVAFASATQDIALDAFRIESADTSRQGALAAAYQTGYRLAMIWAGAGVLWIAARAETADTAAYEHGAWQTAYLVMAASMLVGVLTVLLSREPRPRDAQADRTQRAQVAEMLVRDGRHFAWPQALLFATLIALLAAMVRASFGAIGLWDVGVYLVLGAVAVKGLRAGWGAARPARYVRIRSVCSAAGTRKFPYGDTFEATACRGKSGGDGAATRASTGGGWWTATTRPPTGAATTRCPSCRSSPPPRRGGCRTATRLPSCSPIWETRTPRVSRHTWSLRPPTSTRGRSG